MQFHDLHSRLLRVAFASLAAVSLLNSPTLAQFGGGAPRELYRSIAFSCDGELVADAGGNRIRIWAMEHARLERLIETDGQQVVCMAFSPRGKLLATGCGDGNINLRDTDTGQTLSTLSTEDDTTYKIAFSPDGNWLASTHGQYDDNASARLRLWNVERAEVTQKLVAERDTHVFGISFSPDSREIAAAIIHGSPATCHTEIRLFSVDGRQPQRDLVRVEGMVGRLAYSPNRRTLVGGVRQSRRQNGSAVTLWNVETGELGWSADALQGRALRLAFSPDGKSLAVGASHWSASGRDEGEVTIRDADTGRISAHAIVRGTYACEVAYTPDGSVLGVCSGEQVALLDSKTLAVQSVLWESAE